jgi:hypothetical protein
MKISIIGDGNNSDISDSAILDMSNTFISKDDLIIEGTAGEFSTFTVEFRTINNLRKK